ncbi:ATP-binding cassette domain-containing protein [Diaminobutyricimonas sp. LJ205]|uniref:ATP-binding cassette domain-containing protein n=1 Tax=Diaminobutyricimonas sp. LJ205 TaxID=2683590 RepID=UPI0012F47EE7|nr:ATP-binding cassette domain-containing protein [Diaminobutyricimonas sp. LJ205]
MAIIELSGVRKSYGRTEVLAGIDLQVERGTVFALLGPNGAGKTTTVNIMSTLVRPDAGTVRINGHDVTTDAAGVRRSISLTGQYAAIDGLLTARENLVMMGRLNRLSASAARARAAELLSRFDLTDVQNRRVSTFSGGMRRRLDIAISLIAAPPVIFLDEPTTGLDPRSRQDVWETVEQLVGDGITVLLTTQYLEEADRLADRIAVIDRGQVIAEGTAGELKSRVGADQVEVTWLDGTTERLATDGSINQLRGILDQLEARGQDIADIGIRKPTLDDVFLTLTDRRVPAPETELEGALA